VTICFSLFASSVGILVIPVGLGRWLLFQATGNQRLHELYTVFAGLYAIWLSIRLTTLAYNWLMEDFNQLFNRFKAKLKIVSQPRPSLDLQATQHCFSFKFLKASYAVLLLFGIVPLLLGLLFQQVVINPICCKFDQSPVISLWQVWALGVLHTKILTALTLTGNQWWLKQAIERVKHDRLSSFSFSNQKDLTPLVLRGLPRRLPQHRPRVHI
jgi:E3 ubiquitin-protein ligase MARCH6